MIEQGSEEWFEQRRGKVTASDVKNVLNKNLAGYKNYKAKLVIERLTGQVEESYSNAAMQWGSDNEELAALEYTLAVGNEVEECEFVDHPTIPMSGASPDRQIVGMNGGVEIKCPNTATHIDTLIQGRMPLMHKPQVQWQMACKGWEFVDFVSYDPRMPKGSQIFVTRVMRDDAYIQTLVIAVTEFLAEVDKDVKFLLKYGKGHQVKA